jgi:hypothetical protein
VQCAAAPCQLRVAKSIRRAAALTCPRICLQLQGLGASHAGQTIHYALVDSSGRSSADFSFVVPPLPGSAPAAYPFYFAAFGDLGRGSFDDGITWSEYGQASRSTVLVRSSVLVRRSW